VFEELGDHLEENEELIEVARDSFAPIEDVLDLPEPMEAVVDMMQRLRADRPVGNPTAEAIWARDLVLLKLLISTPLRRRMFACMKWRPDNSGNLYQKLDGSWWVRWKAKYFKNAKFLKKGKPAPGEDVYDSPVHESAWRDIERYLQKHRAVLLRSPTDLLFLSNNQYARNGEEHRPWKEVSERVRTLTRRYLLRCPGIGAHAMRHLVGTSVYKAAPGEIETVAKLLNDKPETVRKHYARFRSADAARRMGDLLGKSLNRM
jgi:integrase